MARPFARAAVWLAGLGSFFFLSYNWANSCAASLPRVPTLAFAWERHLPFLAWTIVPYWSSDLLYAGAFALCRTRTELARLGARLLTIQVFSIACFLLFPLRVGFERPALNGWTGWLFNSLTSFDRPFNQAPSLHVSLALILWVHYRAYLPRWLGAWFALIALSAWTTYQHQFIDLPTGAWAGLLVLAAIPERAWSESRRPGLAAVYLGASVGLISAAFWWRGAGWILLWPAFALSMVAAAYWTGDPAWLGKRGGRMPVWMWPYAAGARVNAWLWTRGQSPWQELEDGVWVGRAPLTTGPFRSIVDLTAELALQASHPVPVLDLTVPRVDQLDAAVATIAAAERPTLVCCALGYSRSATVAAAWWMAHAGRGDARAAVAALRQARPQVLIGSAAIARLEEWWQNRRPG